MSDYRITERHNYSLVCPVVAEGNIAVQVQISNTLEGFRWRLAFPIQDKQTDWVGWGRTLSAIVEGQLIVAFGGGWSLDSNPDTAVEDISFRPFLLTRPEAVGG